ncbi:MAG TPA: phosphatase PAP2 family protein [Thermoleophilaceae bacterium]|nr:phosphatase PAP2 family protein [Thermoleophilaceae bacterium]
MASEVDRKQATAADAADPADTPTRRRPLVIAGVLYVLATFLAVVLGGAIFLSRDIVFLWLMGGLLILSLNNPGRWVRGMVIDWLPFIIFLFAYDYARSLADETGFTPHLAPQLKVETWLFGTPIPTVDWQARFYTPGHLQWYDYSAWIVYITHFFGTLGLAAILWRFAYPLFKKWRTLVIGLSTAGFVTYVLYPAVPPWLAYKTGKLGEVHKVKDEIFNETGTKGITSLVEKNWVDKVAAMPSLHSAFPFMMMLLFWHKGWKWRIPFGLYALAMALTLVYGGEHFWVDVFAGWAYALIVYGLASLWWRRRDRRAAEKAAAEEGARDGGPPAPPPAPRGDERPAPAVSYTAGPDAPPGSG